MRFLGNVCTIILAGVSAHSVYGITSATATIQVNCTGDSKAQVAMRWGHPNYDSTPYMPLYTVHCDGTTQQTQATITDPKSQFEVQTEGGIQTAYTINITIMNGSSTLGIVNLTHAGSPDVITRGTGFHIQRSSGPNQYGEQNFRVYLDSTPTAQVKITAQSTGDKSNAQMALRWGHPDFNDHEYFKLWTIKAGAAQQNQIPRLDNKSEFEIQTEGGEGTGYHLSIWLDQGQGYPMQPSIDISHQLADADVFTGTNPPTSFDASHGNIYGELDVRVSLPQIPPPPPTPPAMSGWAGTVEFCNPTTVSATEYLHIRATLPGSMGASATMTEDNIPLTFPPAGAGISRSGFQTKSVYKPGTWTISSAFITPGMATGNPPRGSPVIGPLTNQVLPSTSGLPLLNFSGNGNCSSQ